MTAKGSPNSKLVQETLVQTLVALAVLAVGSVAFVRWSSVILPARIDEGPMVQMATETSASIVWFTTKPAKCSFEMEQDGEWRSIPIETSDCRHRVKLSGLLPNYRYAYRVKLLGRDIEKKGDLRTNKPVGEPIRFAVLGDSGKRTQEQHKIAKLIEDANPDFILHTGDLVYNDGERHKYRSRFFTPYQKLLSQINYWPCLGNHDVDKKKRGSADAYVEVFDLPTNGPKGLREEYHYWFDYASIRVAVIDSNASREELATKVAPWLRKVMSEPGPRWRLVSLHHPPYTCGKYSPDVMIQEALVPVFEEVGVDVVFCGHDHMYQRSAPLWQGKPVESGPSITYIITGAGGAPLYKPKGSPETSETIDVMYNPKHSFTDVTIDGDVLTMTQINLEGETVDQLTIDKSTGVPVRK